MRNLRQRSFPLVCAALLLASTASGKTILFLGDSLTAGLGLQQSQGFPALIENKIEAEKLPYEVINAGVSGDTSAGGLRRIDWLLQRPIDVLVLELGANDGLRGLPIAAMKQNLQAIIDKVKAKSPQVKIVIAGMQIPPNLGADYARDFRAAFVDLARTNDAALIPFLLEGVGGREDLNQSDQIHPTAAGDKIVAENVWRVLAPLLRKSGS
ncbi:MAG TPA: arylesterase [Chthoniobacterales bacterium]|jgi:acyl-CoA thioesterase-1